MIKEDEVMNANKRATLIKGIPLILALVCIAVLTSTQGEKKEADMIRRHIMEKPVAQNIFELLIYTPITEEVKYRGPFWLLLIILSKIRIKRFLSAVIAICALLAVAAVSSFFWAVEHSHLIGVIIVGLLFCLLVFERNRYLIKKTETLKIGKRLWYMAQPLLLVIFVHQLAEIVLFLNNLRLLNS